MAIAVAVAVAVAVMVEAVMMVLVMAVAVVASMTTTTTMMTYPAVCRVLVRGISRLCTLHITRQCVPVVLCAFVHSVLAYAACSMLHAACIISRVMQDANRSLLHIPCGAHQFDAKCLVSAH